MMTEEDPRATPADAELWSGSAPVFELPASIEYALGAEEDAAPSPRPVVRPADAVAELSACLAEERMRCQRAEEARDRAVGDSHERELDVARLAAELAAERARVAQLERDRDDVIRRAEDLVSAVRQRADDRLASELDAERRHWSELLTEERRRIEALEGDRAGLVKRLEDAFAGGPSLRRSRPLRPSSRPPEVAPLERLRPEEEMEAAERPFSNEPETPEMTAEMERLRERLRAQLHKPPAIAEVEEGVDRLRESRLARDRSNRTRRPDR